MSTVNTSIINNTSVIFTPNIDSSGTAINMSLWRSNLTGVADILTGTTRSATTNILTSTNNNILNLGGRSTTNGMTLNIAGVATNFQATVNTFTNGITAPSIDTGATSTLTIGGSLTTGTLTLGNDISGGFINIGANATKGNATIVIGNQGNAASTNPLTLRTLGTLNLANLAATINMGFGALSGSSTINIGSAAVTTSNLYGLAMNFLATTNTFTNAISAGAIDAAAAAGALLVGATNAVLTLGNTARATTLRGLTLAINAAGSLGSSNQVLTSNGATATWANPTFVQTATGNLNMQTNTIGGTTTLGISTPIEPSGIIYNATTGTGQTTAIGYTLSSGNSAVTSISTSSQTVISNLQIPTPGVYLITVLLITFNSGSAGTNDRLRIYFGYGVINNATNNINFLNLGKVQYGNTIATGYENDYYYSFYYTSLGSSPNNYICLSAQNTGTTTLTLNPVGSNIKAVRIA